MKNRRWAKVILNPAAQDTRIEIQGIDVTPIVARISIQHEPGRALPRIVLTTLALDGIEYEGPAEVLRDTIEGLPYVPSDQELAAEMRRLGDELERRIGHPLFWIPPAGVRGESSEDDPPGISWEPPIYEIGVPAELSSTVPELIRDTELDRHRRAIREELAARFKRDPVLAAGLRAVAPFLDFLARQIDRVRGRFGRGPVE